MESFKANSIINSNSTPLKLVNILKDNELLYPVSFVVRKEETTLKNFINIRLAELRDNGTLEKIMRKKAEIVGISEDEFDNIFIQKYDFK